MRKTIAIFTIKVSGLDPWDPDSIHRGIGESEEAVIYASQELANLGYKVYVFNEPPQGSNHSLPEANPRYLNYLSDQICFDIIIAYKIPESVEYLKHRAKKIYFWPQDESSHHINDEIVNAFDDVLWVSSWQRNQWISTNQKFSQFQSIFGNGIQAYQFDPPKERENPHSCIYASNYGNGLSILLDGWPLVKSTFPKAVLNIYYGWNHLGTLSEAQERNLRHQIKDLYRADVKDHGLIGHQELVRAFSKASLWTYPSIHPETLSITALKAQLAGAIPVVIDGSALQQVIRHGFKCSQKDRYISLLLKALAEAPFISLKQREWIGRFVLEEFTWEKLISKWDHLFSSP